MASNLYEYFKSQGQSLPSVAQRRQTYGLGSSYRGTAQQNQALLSRLRSGGGSQSAASAPSTPAPQSSSVVDRVTEGESAASERFLRDPNLRNIKSKFGDRERELRDSLTETRDRPDYDSIRRSEMAHARAVASSIRRQYEPKLQAEAENAEARNKRARALNLAGGLGGTDFASQNAQKVDEHNAKIRGNIEAEREAKINAVINNVQFRAQSRFDEQNKLFREEAEASLESIERFREEARADLTSLANSGVQLGMLKAQEPEMYEQLVSESGYDPMIFDAVYSQNLPQAERPEYKYINAGGGKIMRFDQFGNQEMYDAGLPDDVDFKITADGTPLYMNKTTGEIRVADGFSQGQFAKPTGGSGSGDDEDIYNDALEYARQNPNNLSRDEMRAELSGSGMKQYQIDAVVNTIGENFPNAPLSIDSFLSGMSDKDLRKEAKEKGFKGKNRVTEYKQSQQAKIDMLRQAGLSDEEIIKRALD